MNHNSEFKSNWLNDNPIYYNKNTKKISYDINEVVDWNNFSFHEEGLKNYFIFGYNVFNQTIFDGVKILPPNSVIDKNLKIKFLEEDYIDKFFDKPSSPDEVIELLREKVRDFEALNSVNNKKYILPLTGGNDSRLLASLLSEKDRVCSYTYPVTWVQKDCYEVGSARYYAKILGFDHKELTNNKIHSKYLVEQMSLYGPTIPINNSLDFYYKIKQDQNCEFKDMIFLSGNCGDWWSGDKDKLKEVENASQFKNVLLNHKMNIDEEYLNFSCKNEDVKQEYFLQNKERLKDRKSRKIIMAQNRIAMIRTVPIKGLEYFKPYFDQQIASKMLMLNEKDYFDRKWQKEYFNKIGLCENKELLKLNKNIKHGLRNIYYEGFELLDAKILQPYFKESFIDNINKNLLKFRNSSLIPFLFDFHYRLSGGYARYFAKKADKAASKKCDYLVKLHNFWIMIKPVELALKRRERGYY